MGVNRVKDGGPAFPASVLHDEYGVSETVAEGGMSLRDYFAGQALAGLLASGSSLVTFENYAACAYHHADAMLKAREE